MQRQFMASVGMFLVSVLAAAEESEKGRAWATLSLAIDSGGSNAEETLSLLGKIHDQAAQAMIEKILSGQNGLAISAVAKGLSRDQSRSFLGYLKMHAVDPAIEPKIGILQALAKADNTDAAEALAQVGDQSVEPDAGLAFSLLEGMGKSAEPALESELRNGQSPSARETTVYIIRARQQGHSESALINALRDSSEGAFVWRVHWL